MEDDEVLLRGGLTPSLGFDGKDKMYTMLAGIHGSAGSGWVSLRDVTGQVDSRQFVIWDRWGPFGSLGTTDCQSKAGCSLERGKRGATIKSQLSHELEVIQTIGRFPSSVNADGGWMLMELNAGASFDFNVWDFRQPPPGGGQGGVLPGMVYSTGCVGFRHPPTLEYAPCHKFDFRVFFFLSHTQLLNQ